MLPQPGEIDSLEVENGDTVEEDDKLATLASRAGKQTIKAPKAGTIINLSANEGDMVSAEEPFAIVADLDEMTAEFGVTSNVLDLIKKDKTYELTFQGETYEADVTEKSVMPNDQGLYTAKVSIENKGNVLLPGMVVQMMVPEKRVKDSVLIPTEALVEESDGAYVYVVSDGKVTKTEIETEEIQSDKTAVKSGLKTGDQVVVTGQTSLADGSEVEVVKEGESS
nr:efflux RND transporter periplasmic adaptor subunit [Lentibacillus sp. JNUCC-1]